MLSGAVLYGLLAGIDNDRDSPILLPPQRIVSAIRLMIRGDGILLSESVDRRAFGDEAVVHQPTAHRERPLFGKDLIIAVGTHGVGKGLDLHRVLTGLSDQRAEDIQRLGRVWIQGPSVYGEQGVRTYDECLGALGLSLLNGLHAF